jgi:hypothetical protein
MAKAKTVEPKNLDRVEELTQLREQICEDLRLSGLDARDEWTRIERTLPEAVRPFDKITEISAAAVNDLVAELRDFAGRVRPYPAPRARQRARSRGTSQHAGASR